MKVLILKPSSLGDVVQALPVLRLLKRHLPDSEIHWWIDSSLAPLLAGDPDLAGLVLFDRRRWSSPLNWDEFFGSIRAMRGCSFDWVIDLQGLLRSGVVAWLAGGGLTVGLDDRREGASAFYDVAVPRKTYHTHAVDWYLSVLPRLGVPVHRDFSWLPPRPEHAAAVARKWDPENAPWIALQPGARWPNKRWPVQFFAELVRRLSAENPTLRFVMLGGADDFALGEAIASTAPRACLNLAGRTSLPEMIEWVRLSVLLVSNDTGPMHVAAALNRPVVALFGPTDPQRTGPYGQHERVIQRTDLACIPCMKSYCTHEDPLACLHQIPPGDVFARVKPLLPSA